MARAGRAPEPADEITYALWGRAGVDDQVVAAGGLGFDVEQVVQP
jgi:hypothetical protein